MTQKQFRLEIVRSIIKKYDISIIKKNISYEAMHYPIRSTNRKTCKNCSETKLYITKKTPISFYFCNVCKVYLCIDCFPKYHERKFKK